MARPTLFTSRKLARLATILGSDALAVGHLELLWQVANETGEPVVGDAVDIETAARWKGEPGALVAALLAAGGPGRPGFVEPAGDAAGVPLYAIHDYWTHAPSYVRKRRAREDERQRSGESMSSQRRATDSSEASRRIAKTPGIGPGERGLSDTPAPAPSPAPSPSLTKDEEATPPLVPPPRRTARGAAEQGAELEKEVRWRIEETWRAHLVAWSNFYERVNGRKPGEAPAFLASDHGKPIREALLEFDRDLLGADQREEWRRRSKVRAAGVGIFYDRWCTGASRDNDAANGGKRYLEHWRPWRRQREKGSPIPRFAELYFEQREAVELIRGSDADADATSA